MTINLARLWGAANELAAGYPGAFSHRSFWLKWPVRIFVPLIYLGALCLWIYRALYGWRAEAAMGMAW